MGRCSRGIIKAVHGLTLMGQTVVFTRGLFCSLSEHSTVMLGSWRSRPPFLCRRKFQAFPSVLAAGGGRCLFKPPIVVKSGFFVSSGREAMTGVQCRVDSDDLPDPDVLAQEIVDNLETALDQFSAVVEGLRA